MFGGRESNGSGRESNPNSSSNANGSSSSGRRGQEGRSKTNFFKKLLPGPWKPRSQGWEEQLQSLPDGMRAQVLEQVQGQHAKGKKLRILFDDGENIGSDDIMRATNSGPRIRTDPTVFHFFKFGELTYNQALAHGFYVPFGDFPEVAEKDELPPLSALIERCSVLEGREVVLIDPQLDNDLRSFLDGPVVEVASAAGEAHMVRVQRVAVLVANRLGGAMADGALGAQYSTYSQSVQHTQGSTVLLLGSLSVGTSCHRALLAKLALLRVGITTAIRPVANSRLDGVAPQKQLFWQREDSVEYDVNLTDRPGELTQVSAQATVSVKPSYSMSSQGTPPQSQQQQQQPGMQASLPSTAAGTSYVTPPGSPRFTHGSGHTAAVAAAAAAVAAGTPGQPVGIYDFTLSMDPTRHGSASTQAPLSRGGSATSLMTATTGGARGGVPGGVPLQADLGVQLDLDGGGSGAVVEQSNSSFRDLRAVRGTGSPRGGGSLPLEAFQRGGSMTPPRSLSPTPATFINRLPNPFAPGLADAVANPAGSAISAGSGLSTQASINTATVTQPSIAEVQSAALAATGGATGASAATVASVATASSLQGVQPKLVAWPFGNPEILSVAVRMQRSGTSSGSRRRAGAGGNSAGALSLSAIDDAHHLQQVRDRERERERERAHNEAVMFMSTESSTGAGGGQNGSFITDSGAVQMQTASGGAASSHTRHPSQAQQLASGLGKPPGIEQSSHSFSQADVSATTSAPVSLHELSPPLLNHSGVANSSPSLSGDYGGLPLHHHSGAAHSASVPALPQSSPAAGHAQSGSRRRHRHSLTSAFEGSGELRAGAAEAFQNIPQPRVSPSRPPVPPSSRSGLSANTASPPHGSPVLETSLDAWPSSSAPPRLSDLNLRPDAGAGASAGPSDEMAAWWHGSSRFEVLTQVSDPSRMSGLSDYVAHGGGRTPGGGDSSLAASSYIDGAGFSGSTLGTAVNHPGSITTSSRPAAKSAFADSTGNGSDTELEEAASGAVQKFPPIPEAPERWGIGVVTALPSGFGGDDDSDAGRFGPYKNPTGNANGFETRDSGGSANLDISSTFTPTQAAVSAPTRAQSPLSATAQDGGAAGRCGGASGSRRGPAAGVAKIFKGAFDSESETGSPSGDGRGVAKVFKGAFDSESEAGSPRVDRRDIAGAQQPRPPQSNGSYRGPQGDDENTLTSAGSQHSDSTNSRSGRSGARPFAGRLLSPFGEDEDEGDSEDDNVAGAAGGGVKGSSSGPKASGMLQPLAGAFGGGVASSLLSPFADNDAGNSGEVSIHSNRIPPVAGAGSSSMTSPHTPRPARNNGDTSSSMTGVSSRPFSSKNGTRRSDGNGKGGLHPFTNQLRQQGNAADYDSEEEADIAAELDHGSDMFGSRGAGHVDMSGAISLDHNSTALPSAQANLQALMQNTSIHTLEAQFRMWINTSDITMTETVIGRGSYGQVMLAKFRTERCAVKQIVCETKAEYRAAMQEMLLMQELQFDKIVRFFGAIKRGKGVLWMCMEYMPFSDLRKILHNAEHRQNVRFAESMLSLPRRLKWAKDVVAALDLLHSRAVVHRDLKPGNVLISNKGDAVLSDFGLSRVREAQQSRLQASGPGTVSYAAPEALQANQVSPASDMFSFGCVLWELLSMKEPWAELHGATFQIMSKICHEKASLRVEDIPEDVRGMVSNVIVELRKCLSFDPDKRPSAEHVYGVLDDAIESL